MSVVSLASRRQRIAATGSAPDEATADGEEDDPALTPRGRYNRGLELFRAADFEGARDAFLKARDEAGNEDPTAATRSFTVAVAPTTTFRTWMSFWRCFSRSTPANKGRVLGSMTNSRP